MGVLSFRCFSNRLFGRFFLEGRLCRNFADFFRKAGTGHGSVWGKCEKIEPFQVNRVSCLMGDRCKLPDRMETVSGMGCYRFESFVFSAVVLATGCALVPSVSFAGQQDECLSVDCRESSGQKDGVLEKIREAAQQGDAQAQMALGLRYLMGDGLAADEAVAQEWFLKSARQNNVVAQVALATMLAFESDRQDLPAAAMWFSKAAGAGNVQAMSELVRLYETGSGVTRDMAKADEWRNRAKARSETVRLDRAWKIALAGKARWMKPVSPSQTAGAGQKEGTGRVPDMAALTRAAENGDDEAQTVLGGLLATGDGVVKNDAAALEWFEKAADSGNGQARAVLGELTASGWGGLKQDEVAAARLMEKAALDGVVPAQAEWGTVLMEGKGVGKDPAKGLSWVAKAAQEGDGRARLKMGMMLLGQGDRDAAAKWFEGAAAVGDDEVLSALAVFYGWGDGPVFGESEKLTEVRRYAQRDESEAQQMMGFLYGEGWGARRDPRKAEYWFDKAAAGGDVEVWLPLGLLYAETGREKMAADAFGRAVALGGFGLANDGELLELIFVDPERLPDMGSALKHPAPAKKTTGGVSVKASGKKADGTDKNGFAADGRLERVAKKRAFVAAEAEKGNPAAQLMMARILSQGWGVKKDEQAAASLRADGMRGMCSALKEKAEEEPLCSKGGDDGNGAALPDVGKTEGSGDSGGFAVRQGVK